MHSHPSTAQQLSRRPSCNSCNKYHVGIYSESMDVLFECLVLMRHWRLNPCTPKTTPIHPPLQRLLASFTFLSKTPLVLQVTKPAPPGVLQLKYKTIAYVTQQEENPLQHLHFDRLHSLRYKAESLRETLTKREPLDLCHRRNSTCRKPTTRSRCHIPIPSTNPHTLPYAHVQQREYHFLFVDYAEYVSDFQMKWGMNYWLLSILVSQWLRQDD